MTDTDHPTPTLSIDEAIEHMEGDRHTPYEIRSGSESADDCPPGVPSMTTADEWYELDEEPRQDYQARCACGEVYSTWGQAKRCTGE